MAADASILVALIWKARHRIAGHFCAMHALSSEDAVAYLPQTPAEQAEFARLRAKAIVREAIRDHYWLDLAAFDAETAAWRRRAVPFVLFAAVALAAAVMILANLSRG